MSKWIYKMIKIVRLRYLIEVMEYNFFFNIFIGDFIFDEGKINKYLKNKFSFLLSYSKVWIVDYKINIIKFKSDQIFCQQFLSLNIIFYLIRFWTET
jgi:hypothetical protein